MPKYEPLNPNDHARLRVRPTQGAGPHFAQIVPSEFPAAAASAPIVFTKDPDKGTFYAGAMLGFKPNEGALKNTRERGGFEPLTLQREGFFTMEERIVVDREHPRFSETEGDPLFDEAREPSPRLRQVQRLLGRLHAGLQASEAFVQAMLELKLIEPINISLAFDDGEKLALQSLYTVSLDALHQLDDAQATRLFRAGHLQLAYIMSQSLQQIAILAELRNKKLAGEI